MKTKEIRRVLQRSGLLKTTGIKILDNKWKSIITENIPINISDLDNVIGILTQMKRAMFRDYVNCREIIASDYAPFIAALSKKTIEKRTTIKVPRSLLVFKPATILRKRS